jgi:hypothetical protein
VLRKVLVFMLVVLAGLYVAADLGARAAADAGVAKELQTSLQLSRRPDVSLGRFPFIPKLVAGRFDQVHATAHGFRTSGGLRFAEVTLDLRDVTFSALRVLRGADSSIGIGNGTGTATLTGGEITDAMRAKGVGARVSIENGRPEVSVGGAAQHVPVETSVQGTTLLVRSGALPGEIRIPLAAIVPTIEFTAVSFRADRAVLSFTVSKTRLQISG